MDFQTKRWASLHNFHGGRAAPGGAGAGAGPAAAGAGAAARVAALAAPAGGAHHRARGLRLPHGLPAVVRPPRPTLLWGWLRRPRHRPDISNAPDGKPLDDIFLAGRITTEPTYISC
jgi:hypothetical protein